MANNFPASGLVTVDSLLVCGISEFRDTVNYTYGKLSWGGSPQRLVLSSCGTYNLGLATDNFTDRMTIQASTGYVGIGTTAPGYSLDVAGGMKGNFYMSCCNATIDGVGPYDYGIIGTGNGAGALLINDIVGARYAVHAGSYNLTFRKSVRGTSTACAYCTVMTFLGTTDTNCVVNVSIANSLGVGTNPSYRLQVSDTASTKISLTGGTTQNGIRFEKAGSGCGFYIFNGEYASTVCGFGIYNLDTTALPMFINNSSNIGINTTTPSYRLHVNGTFYAAGSSIKYKEGICNYDTDSCLFMCLKPVTYQYKDEWQHLGRELKSQSQIGLIAEDVAEVMPELAILVNEEDEKVVRNVDYEKLSVVLLKEVQKLRQEVDELKNNK